MSGEIRHRMVTATLAIIASLEGQLAIHREALARLTGGAA